MKAERGGVSASNHEFNIVRLDTPGDALRRCGFPLVDYVSYHSKPPQKDIDLIDRAGSSNRMAWHRYRV